MSIPLRQSILPYTEIERCMLFLLKDAHGFVAGTQDPARYLREIRTYERDVEDYLSEAPADYPSAIIMPFGGEANNEGNGQGHHLARWAVIPIQSKEIGDEEARHSSPGQVGTYRMINDIWRLFHWRDLPLANVGPLRAVLVEFIELEQQISALGVVFEVPIRFGRPVRDLRRIDIRQYGLATDQKVS